MNKIQKAYDRWFNVYENNINPTRDLSHASLKTADISFNNQKVLDLGCGTGLNTRWMLEQKALVTGVDFSSGMLSIAKNSIKHANVSFIEMDLLDDWNFDNSYFDIVVSCLVLEHIKNVDQIFRKISPILSDDGYLFMSELHPFKQIFGSQARFIDKENGKEEKVNVFQHSITEFIEAGLNSGLKIDAISEPSDYGEENPRLLNILWKKSA